MKRPACQQRWPSASGVSAAVAAHRPAARDVSGRGSAQERACGSSPRCHTSRVVALLVGANRAAGVTCGRQTGEFVGPNQRARGPRNPRRPTHSIRALRVPTGASLAGVPHLPTELKEFICNLRLKGYRLLTASDRRPGSRTASVACRGGASRAAGSRRRGGDVCRVSCVTRARHGRRRRALSVFRALSRGDGRALMGEGTMQRSTRRARMSESYLIISPARGEPRSLGEVGVRVRVQAIGPPQPPVVARPVRSTDRGADGSSAVRRTCTWT